MLQDAVRKLVESADLPAGQVGPASGQTVSLDPVDLAGLRRHLRDYQDVEDAQRALIDEGLAQKALGRHDRVEVARIVFFKLESWITPRRRRYVESPFGFVAMPD